MKIKTPAPPDVQMRHARIRAQIAEAAGMGPEKAREILARQFQEFDEQLREDPGRPPR